MSSSQLPKKKIGIVAGEASGDILGAGLMKSLQEYYPDAEFTGIGGDRMIAEGFQTLFPLERLSVMGIVEPLKRLPELLSIRKQLFEHFSQQACDLFIGIDSPEFNLTLEEKLKQKGIKTVHYVSPSVWAWRQNRIKKIARCVDLMLTLLPFENAIYEKNNIPVTFVGHPLADHFPLDNDLQQSKNILHTIVGDEYDQQKPTLACLPGSRGGEVKLIGPVFWDAIRQCKQKISGLQVVVPASSANRLVQIQEQLQDQSDLQIIVLQGHSHEVMAAADAVLLASGTTALEAMLLKKPMVVAYKVAWLSYFILSRMVKTLYISLPNLLANKTLVPELLQSEATPEKIVDHVIKCFQSGDNNEKLIDEFKVLHQRIQQNASETAAAAIHRLLEAS
jgi:lipid-A-disaccharide synthase